MLRPRPPLFHPLLRAAALVQRRTRSVRALLSRPPSRPRQGLILPVAPAPASLAHSFSALLATVSLPCRPSWAASRALLARAALAPSRVRASVSRPRSRAHIVPVAPALLSFARSFGALLAAHSLSGRLSWAASRALLARAALASVPRLAPAASPARSSPLAPALPSLARSLGALLAAHSLSGRLSWAASRAILALAALASVLRLAPVEGRIARAFLSPPFLPPNLVPLPVLRLELV
ncbi:hypothetical protein C8Q76DRAFT_801763 [Earliella scabrosa]|nr:hypothetical protein C8Q76DRAFT_801763 [Earliella scabrosa]